MCHLNITCIRKHRPWAYILGFIELPYFGSEQFRKIYLVERICICIWINVFVFVFVFESMLNKIFVFVFVFEKSKFLYLYLYLIKRIWPQPWPLSEPMMIRLTTHICVTRPQWVDKPDITCQLPLKYAQPSHYHYGCGTCIADDLAPYWHDQFLIVNNVLIAMEAPQSSIGLSSPLWAIDTSRIFLICSGHINSLRPRQNRRHFADNVFKCNFFNENVWILIKISLKLVP